MFIGFNWVNNHKIFVNDVDTIRCSGHFSLLLYLFLRRFNFINWNSSNKTEVSFIDLNNFRFLKLVSMIVFCDLEKEVFEATLQETFMIWQYVIGICLFEFIKTIWHWSYLWADYFLNRYIILDTCVPLKAWFTISDITFNAIIRYLSNPYLIFVHPWEAFVVILWTFASPLECNWFAFKKRVAMHIAFSFIRLNLTLILREYHSHSLVSCLLLLYSLKQFFLQLIFLAWKKWYKLQFLFHQ